MMVTDGDSLCWSLYDGHFMMVTSDVGGIIIMLATFFVMLVIFSMY